MCGWSCKTGHKDNNPSFKKGTEKELKCVVSFSFLFFFFFFLDFFFFFDIFFL